MVAQMGRALRQQYRVTVLAANDGKEHRGRRQTARRGTILEHELAVSRIHQEALPQALDVNHHHAAADPSSISA
jgi:hypothetical protein